MRMLKQWVNFKVILGASLFAMFIFGVLLVIIWSARAKIATPVSSTAILNVIKASTATPLVPVTTPTVTPEPTFSNTVPAPSGNIAVGDYVQVTGTGGDGLRLHESAGVSSKVKYIAIDSEVFIVKDGPSTMDGYTWWLLQDPYTNNAAGWGAANYLVVVQNP